MPNDNPVLCKDCDAEITTWGGCQVCNDRRITTVTKQVMDGLSAQNEVICHGTITTFLQRNNIPEVAGAIARKARQMGYDVRTVAL